MVPELLFLVILTSLIGALAGTFTGLVPGIHVNTLASMMLVAYPVIETTIANVTEPMWAPILVSTCIMSASVVHSFVDFVPSVFLGAPDPDEALSLLPGHRLLMNGHGMRGVRAAAIGSTVGAVAAILLSIPLQYLMLNGLADKMDMFTFALLTITLTAIILGEKGTTDRVWAMILIILSGTLGLMCIHLDLPCNGILGEGTLLFPLLTGLFGMPAMLTSIKNAMVPEQHDDIVDPVGPIPGIKGVITGCLAGWYPGITATAGASLASAITPEKDPARFISLVASIGTVTTVFSLVTLSVSGSGRSGTVLVIKEIVGDGISGFCSQDYLLLLMSVAVATCIGYIVTIKTGKMMSRMTEHFDIARMNKAIIVFMTALVLILTGPFGTFILIISTIVGMIPVRIGMDRIPLAGCLIVPTMLMELGLIETILGIL